MNTIKILYVLGLVGLLDTLYLIYHKIRGTDVACPFFPDEWCRIVQHSKQSKTFGIPNSILGFFMYLLIIALAYYHSLGTVPFWPIQAVVTFGFLFSLYFVYIQAFVLRAFCTWCVVSGINFSLMFITVWFW